MDEELIEKEMYDKAVKFLWQRYGEHSGGVAHKYNKKITHCLCVARQEEGEEIKILTPCGVCQERLYYWGSNVKCAVSNDKNKLIFKSLHELQPYYWNLQYKD